MRWVLYVDLDAFYVSCELRDRPELRGRPVIVGPDPRLGPTRGVVLSASYEARAFGVRSAMPVGRALERCPEAVWLPADFEKYGQVSAAVREALAERFREVVMLSIDEAAVGLEADDEPAAEGAGRDLQKGLHDRLGLPCSVGIAPWRVLAKIATDRAKPGGVVVVSAAGAADFLAPLEVASIPGVGPKTADRLIAHGVRTIGQLAHADPTLMRRIVGRWAPALLRLARGEFPPEAPLREAPPVSRSLDRTFLSDRSSLDEVVRSVRELAQELADGVRREGLAFRSVSVALRWSDFTSAQRQHTLAASTDHSEPLRAEAERLTRLLWERERAGAGRAVRRASVRVSRLTARPPAGRALEEFAAAPPAVK